MFRIFLGKEEENQRPVALETLLVKSSILEKIPQCWQLSESGDFYKATLSSTLGTIKKWMRAPEGRGVKLGGYVAWC